MLTYESTTEVKAPARERTDLLTFTPSGNISFTFSVKMMATRLGTSARLFIQRDSPSSTHTSSQPLLTTFPNSASSRVLKKESSSKSQNWMNIYIHTYIPRFRCFSVSKKTTWNFKLKFSAWKLKVPGVVAFRTCWISSLMFRKLTLSLCNSNCFCGGEKINSKFQKKKKKGLLITALSC